jgi:hypothetical protein
MSSKLLPLLKRWWFWLCVVLLCAIPTDEWMGATGDHYDYGVPFPSLYVKHGNMGTGGKLSEGFLFFPDGWPRPASGDRTGWFIHPEPIGIGLNVALSLLVVYGLTQIWQKIRHAKQDG